MGSPNGGIVGVINPTSFGKCTVTSQTSSGTLTTQPGTRLANVAVIAGGGSGGNLGSNIAGGGGGGGGLALTNSYSVCGTTGYPITIGAGGSNSPACGSPGSDSNIVIGSTTITGKGGGKGGSYNSGTGGNQNGSPGGSGGGGSGPACGIPANCGIGTGGTATQPTQPALTSVTYYGNSGGCGVHSPGQGVLGGGGGGANAAGGDYTPTNSPFASSPLSGKTAGVGGAGKDVSSCFSPTVGASGFVAGGGGSGAHTSANPGDLGGAGGAGGGGQGAPHTSPASSTAGTANTGGGGGGGGNSAPNSGKSGGSGIVIVKELNKASGVWNLKSQFSAQKQGTWPKPALAPFSADYLVVAGGGAGASTGGGGGAGGYRESSGVATGSYTVSPLGSGVSALTLSATTFPITIGAGGASSPGLAPSRSGSDSIFSTITSTGGGGGGLFDSVPGSNGGANGGSGGGGAAPAPPPGPGPGGTGNTPPVSPPQGSAGGGGFHQGCVYFSGGGGGGATAVGATGGNGASSGPAGQGGAGATSSITGSPVGRGGGGNGGGDGGPAGSSVGFGGGAAGSSGTINTGGGGGSGPTPGSGGSGIIVVRTPSATSGFISATPGTNTVTSAPCGAQIASFTVSGSLVVSQF